MKFLGSLASCIKRHYDMVMNTGEPFRTNSRGQSIFWRLLTEPSQ